jgi:hypothetical protein
MPKNPSKKVCKESSKFQAYSIPAMEDQFLHNLHTK